MLLADAQTSGGYPKIATVIRADLPPPCPYHAPGEEIRFASRGPRRGPAALLRRTADPGPRGFEALPFSAARRAG